MPPEEYVRVGVSLRGELARALSKEYQKAARKSLDAGDIRPPSMADVVRQLIVEGLQRRGYAVENDMQWGGSRERSEDSSDPESVAVAAY